MILNALLITGIGMGGVFAFLLLLITGMTGLRLLAGRIGPSDREKVAVAIAAACLRRE